MVNIYNKYNIYSLHFGAYHNGENYILPRPEYITDIEFDREHNPITDTQGRHFYNMPDFGSISFISHLSPYYSKENGENKSDAVYNLPIREDVIKINKSIDNLCCGNETGVRYINFFGHKLYFNKNPYTDYDSSNLTTWNLNQWSTIQELYTIIKYYSFASYGNRNEGIYTGFLNGFTGYSGIPIDSSGTGGFAFFDKGYLLSGTLTNLNRACRGCIDEIILNTGYYKSICNGSGQGSITGEIKLRYNSYNLLKNQDNVNQERIFETGIYDRTYISYHFGNILDTDPLNVVEVIKNEIEAGQKLFDKDYFPYFVQSLNLNSPSLKNFNKNNDEISWGSDQTSNFRYIPNITGKKIFLSRQFNTSPIIEDYLFSGEIYSGLYKGIEPYTYPAKYILDSDNIKTTYPSPKILRETYFNRINSSGIEESLSTITNRAFLVCWLDASDRDSYVISESLYSDSPNKVILWKNKVLRSGDDINFVKSGDAIAYELSTGYYISGYYSNASGILVYNSPTNGDTFSVTGYFTGFGSTITSQFSSTPGNESPNYFDSIITLNAIINSGYFGSGITSTLRGVTGLNIKANKSGELGNLIRICTSYDAISNTTSPYLLNNNFQYNLCDTGEISGFLDGGIDYKIFTTNNIYQGYDALTAPNAGPSFGITGSYGELNQELNYPNLSINFNHNSCMMITGLNQEDFKPSAEFTMFIVENGTTGFYNRLLRSKFTNVSASSLASGSVVKTPSSNSTQVGLPSGPIINNPYMNSGINVLGIRYVGAGASLRTYLNSTSSTLDNIADYDFSGDILLGSNRHLLPTGFIFTGNLEQKIKESYSGIHLGLSGNVCEILIYNSALSSLSMTNTMNYLRLKWSGLLSGVVQNSGLVEKITEQKFPESYKINSTNLCTECVDNVPKSGEKHILLMEYNLYGDDNSQPYDCFIDSNAYVLKTGYYEESPKEPAIMKMKISDTQIFPTGQINNFQNILNQYNVIKNINNRGQIIHNLEDFNYTQDSVNFNLTNYNQTRLKLEVENANCNCTGNYPRFFRIDALGDKSGCNLSNLNNFIINIYDSGNSLVLSEDFSNKSQDISGNNYGFIVGLYPGVYDIVVSGKERYFDYGPDTSNKFLNASLNKIISSNNYTNISNIYVKFLEDLSYYDINCDTNDVIWASYNLDPIEPIFGSGLYSVNYNKPKAFTIKLKTFDSGRFDYPEFSFYEKQEDLLYCSSIEITDSICENNYGKISALCTESLKLSAQNYTSMRVNSNDFPFTIFGEYLTYLRAGTNYYDIAIDDKLKDLCCLCKLEDENIFNLGSTEPVSCITYSGISLEDKIAKRRNIDRLNTGIYFLDRLSLNEIKNKYGSSIYSGYINTTNLLEGDQLYFNSYTYDYIDIFERIFGYYPTQSGVEHTFTYSIENTGQYYFSGAETLANLINENLGYTGHYTWIPTIYPIDPYYKIGGLLSGRLKNSNELDLLALNSGKLGQYNIQLKLVDRVGFDIFQVPKVIKLQGSNDGENWEDIISSENYVSTNIYSENPDASIESIRYDLIEPEYNLTSKNVVISSVKELKQIENVTGNILKTQSGIGTGQQTVKYQCLPAPGESGKNCGSGYLDILSYRCDGTDEEDIAEESDKEKDKDLNNNSNYTSGTLVIEKKEYLIDLGFANYNEGQV